MVTHLMYVLCIAPGWLRLYVMHNVKITREELELANRVFEQLDVNHTGFLEASDLDRAYRSVLEKNFSPAELKDLITHGHPGASQVISRGDFIEVGTK